MILRPTYSLSATTKFLETVKNRACDSHASAKRLNAWLQTKRAELDQEGKEWFDGIFEKIQTKADIAQALGFKNSNIGHQFLFYLGENLRGDYTQKPLSSMLTSLKKELGEPKGKSGKWKDEFFENLTYFFYYKHSILNSMEEHPEPQHAS